MTADEVDQAVATAFRTAWGGTTPIAWDNVPFDSESRTEFARLSLQHISGELVELAGSMFRRQAVLFVQVFTAANAGKSRALQLGEQAMAIFEARPGPVSGVRFRRVGLQDVGLDGRFYQVNVSAAVEYDQYR